MREMLEEEERVEAHLSSHRSQALQEGWEGNSPLISANYDALLLNTGFDMGERETKKIKL